MHDIEDDDLGLYCSFAERVQHFVPAITAALATGEESGFIDTYLFVPHAEVLRLLNQHFQGLATIQYECCKDNDACDAHDGHLCWIRS